MNSNTKSIANYIEFLKQNYNLFITLHPLKYEDVISTSDLFRYNIHTNPYCLYMKTNAELWQQCTAKQGKVLEKCKGGSFVGVCHAGVEEFVYPINCKDEVVGFISVSGYQASEELAKSYVKRISDKYCFDLKKTFEIYEKSLSAELLEKSFVDTIMMPLSNMLELAYLKQPEINRPQNSNEQTYHKILHYININHSNKITVSNLCNIFHFSPSYISHLFKKTNGKSINEYINQLRINDAKSLLTSSKLNIEEIAMAIGFSNSNYFSNVFKVATGLSPLNYRKSITRTISL